jgi:hypothetical protein
MLAENYKGREVRIELVSTTDLTGRVNEHLRAYVNGTGQFSFNKYTDPAFALVEIKRYIDAVDMAAERNAQKVAAGDRQTAWVFDDTTKQVELKSDPAYLGTNQQDFAASWQPGPAVPAVAA